jgi:uncharacterized protein YjiS (DUF1127 family)
MRDSDDFHFLRFEHRPLSPEQLDRLQRGAERAAKEYRARTLRSLGAAALAWLRSAAAGGQDMVRAVGQRAAAAASKQWQAYALRRLRRAAVKELAALDDRTLKDLGIHRSEIESVVYRRDAAPLPARALPARRCQPAARAGANRRPAPWIERSAA